MINEMQLATDTVIAAGPILGQIGVPGIAVADGMYLVMGLRGAKRASLTRDKAANMGIVFGALATAAGGTLAQAVEGVGQVPTNVLQGVGDSISAGDFGLGATALCLGIFTYVPDWKKLGIPAVSGVALGASAAAVGGLYLIANNILLMVAKGMGAL